MAPADRRTGLPWRGRPEAVSSLECPCLYTENTTSCVHHIVITIVFQFLQKIQSDSTLHMRKNAISCAHCITITIAFRSVQNSVNSYRISVKIRNFRKFLQTAGNSYRIPYKLNQCSDYYNDSMLASESYRLSPIQTAG